ncbi:MAG: FAD-dependent monooxygenase [Micromonosporaceae bacterium]|nr:FAD-dependent monooxygenase [Micromonosporaceae bacterium]
MVTPPVQRSGHAIVVGASMAGLLAARVLAETFAQVTVVDRDALPDEPIARRGVPQGRHAHGLLARGREILEELFPGLTEELVSRHGAVAADIQRDAAWINDGHPMRRDFADMLCLVATRPLLEWYVRDRVTALPGVTLRPNTEALGLVAAGNGSGTSPTRRRAGRVNGLRVLASGEETVLAADLVVDATGRSNRGPTWLAELGYEAPTEEKIDPGLVYVSATFERKPDDYDGIAAVVGATLANPRGGVVLAVENDQWMVTLYGMGDEAPTDAQSYVEWAARLPRPDIHQAIAEAPVVEAPRRMRIGPSTWRRYDKLRRFPEGFLVIGDAICALNPAYGQGMTTAAVEALALRDCLARGRRGLAKRFFARAAKIVAIPWSVAVTADLRFPHVQGRRTRAVRFLNWYIARVHRVAARDGAVGKAFLRVANLIDPPQRLFAPAIAAKVLRGH